jgi:hypothetical protein
MWHRNNYIHRSNAVGASILAFLAGAAVWAIFGNKVKDKINNSPRFQEMKDQVYKKASEVQDLTREKYDQIVDEVSDKYARLQGISKHELVDLVDDLKMHWGRMKRAWNE